MPGPLRMRRDLTAPLAPAAFPPGVVLADFDRDIAPACRDLMNRAYGETGDTPVGFAGWYGRLTGDTEYDPALVWVAMGGGQVIGFCQGWSVPFIKDLVVEQRWRGRGLGSALLTLAMQTYAERGDASVELKTEPENREAQSLYRRLGFAVVERIDG